MPTSGTRILAIDPGTRYMGVVVLERNELIHYGVVDLRRKRPATELLTATREALGNLIKTFQPAVLAYEELLFVQSETSKLMVRQEAELRRIGAAFGLHVVSYDPLTVRRKLCSDGHATKLKVADLLVGRFPELRRYRAVQSALQERYWLNMFDALAVAVISADEADRRPRRGERSVA